MKLLVVGDATSQFVLNFSVHLKEYYTDVQIHILNTNSSEDSVSIERKSGSAYDKVFCYYKKIPLINKIPGVRGVVRLFTERIVRIHVKKQSYDVACVHGLFATQCRIVRWLPNVTSFIVAAFWGSDLYKRKENKNESQVTRALQICDRISLSTMSMRNDLLREIKVPVSKLRNCQFGLKPLELLFSSAHISKKDAKTGLGFGENTFVIACGYNGHHHQQHLAIIDGLVKNRDEIPADHLLILPMTYGATQEYKNQVISALDDSRLKYRVFENFLSDKDIVLIRKATDILVQVQKTDAFSGSMQEHLFCGNIVITGAWLPYESLSEKGIVLEKIEKIDLLPEKIGQVLKNRHTLQMQVEAANTPDKFESSLWSVCIHNWYNLLNEYRTPFDNIK
jgi:hypothetical protein